MSQTHLSKMFVKDNKMSVENQHLGWSDSRQSLVIDFEHDTLGCGYFLINADGTWDAILPD